MQKRHQATGTVALAVAAVAAAFTVGYLSRGQAPAPMPAVAPVPAPVTEPAPSQPRPLPPMPPQPLPAASSFVAPVPLATMPSARKPAAVSAGKVPVVTAKAVKWARTHPVFTTFLKAPARMLAGKGARLSSPGALKSFLADRAQVEAYLDSPLVRIALNSPVVSKALLADPAVATAFLGSPAMRDPAAVKALMTSDLFRKVIDCPGPQAALEDPKTLTSLLTNPETVRWLSENPDAMKAVTQALPELAAAYAPKIKKRR